MPESIKPSGAHLPAWFLLVTTGVCGALVMVIEVLGSRVIGPFFGVSLFVWTSLITVTLVALALGYAIGGRLADRRDHPDWLYGTLLVAGALVALVPLLRGPVLKACVPLGLKAGAFVSASILFCPALLLLGFVSPYVVKLAARETAKLGSTVGLLYAVSTGGSFVGTVLTGFVLVAYLRVSSIFFLVAGLLTLIAATYFLVFRRRWLAALTPVLPLALGLWLDEPLPQRVLDIGTNVRVVERVDNYYGTVKVVEYWYGPRRTRELLLDGHIQGGVDATDGRSVFSYAYYLQHLPRALLPEGASCLAVGLGAGIVPAWYQRLGVRTDAVDINPAVVDMARKHFGFAVAGEVFVEDARTLLQRLDRSYDYILLDVFSGDSTPGHLLSQEALAVIKARLSPRGVVAANLIVRSQGDTWLTRSIVKTFASLFEHVVLYPLFDPARSDSGNLTLLAWNSDAPAPVLDDIAQYAVHAMAVKELAPAWGRRWDLDTGADSIVLTDAFNPADARDSDVREVVRRNMLASTHLDILL